MLHFQVRVLELEAVNFMSIEAPEEENIIACGSLKNKRKKYEKNFTVIINPIFSNSRIKQMTHDVRHGETSYWIRLNRLFVFIAFY